MLGGHRALEPHALRAAGGGEHVIRGLPLGEGRQPGAPARRCGQEP
jgi:hypothetical protein